MDIKTEVQNIVLAKGKKVALHDYNPTIHLSEKTLL